MYTRFKRWSATVVRQQHKVFNPEVNWQNFSYWINENPQSIKKKSCSTSRKAFGQELLVIDFRAQHACCPE